MPDVQSKHRESDNGLIRTPELAERTGISFRRLDHWTRKGYLRPEGKANPGTGFQRQWKPEEVEIVRSMEMLTKAGIPPELASVAAREAEKRYVTDKGKRWAYTTADGIEIRWPREDEA